MKMNAYLLIVSMLASSAFATCPASPPADPTTVSALPTLQSATFPSTDILTLTVVAPPIQGRTYWFQFNLEGNCVTTPDFHPGGNWLWSQDGSCNDVFQANFSWPILSNGAVASPSATSDCGFNVYVLEDRIVYNGTLLVTQIDPVGTIRGQVITRNTTSPLALSITFPRYAAINSTNLEIFSPVNVIAAIFGQSWDNLAHTGQFRLFTSVQYPFNLSVTPTMTAEGNSGIHVVPHLSNNQGGNNCLPDSGDCNVVYDLDISGSFCFLAGSFGIDFVLACRAGVTDCPLLPGDHATVTWVTQSSDLCGNVDHQATLTVSIASYDSDYSTPRTGFLIGKTMYIGADANSSEVSISKRFIQNCTLIPGPGSPSTAHIPLVISGTSTSNCVAAPSVSASCPTALHMQVSLDPALVSVPVDGNITAVVECYVGVEYSGVAYSKRYIVAGAAQPKLQNKRGFAPVYTEMTSAQSVVGIEYDSSQYQPTLGATEYSGSARTHVFALLVAVSVLIALFL